MVGSQLLNELMRGILGALPSDVRTLHNDIEKNLRAALNGTFAKLNLVTREEFDIQSALLARARTQLKMLEAQVATLETQLADAKSAKSGSRKHGQES